MESTNKVQKRYSQRVEDVDPPKVEYKTKPMVLQIDAKYKVKSRCSGSEYLFNGAGSVIYVDERDVKWMLELRQGSRQCCGGNPEGNIVFKLAE